MYIKDASKKEEDPYEANYYYIAGEDKLYKGRLYALYRNNRKRYAAVVGYAANYEMAIDIALIHNAILRLPNEFKGGNSATSNKRNYLHFLLARATVLEDTREVTIRELEGCLKKSFTYTQRYNLKDLATLLVDYRCRTGAPINKINSSIFKADFVSQYGTDNKQQANYQKILDFMSCMGMTGKNDPVFQNAMKKIATLNQRSKEEKDDWMKVFFYEKKIEIYEDLFDQGYDFKRLKRDASNTYGGLAWYQILTGQFREAERSIYNGFDLDRDNQWLNINLAPALLLQGDYYEAEDIYKEYRYKRNQDNRLYRDLFLEDFKAMEARGIKHRDIDRIKQLLRRNYD